MDEKRVLIIGGGASGLMAGIFAARNGASVTILEQNDRVGRKLGATGGGRCNFSNRIREADSYRGTRPEFVNPALEFLSVPETVAFFEKLGLLCVGRNGWLYPRSLQAQSVTEILCMEARNLGVRIRGNQKILKLLENTEEGGEKGKQAFRWTAFTEGWQYEGDTVILACGSKASSIAGSDGSGYILAKALGHRLVEPLPALTGLRCSGKAFAGWAGVRTEGQVTLFLDGRKVTARQGELQLTDYGISGIPVFEISRYAIRGLHEGKKASLTVDFLPEIGENELPSFMERRKKCGPFKDQQELLTGLFPRKLIPVLTRQKDLFQALKRFPLDVEGGLSFSHAQVCSGGVDTRQVNENTMESRLHGGLYFAGEFLDIDGSCGGYNLQWAWSSGALAGARAADRSKI
ncbi:MAG: NAD(P)/FAD-dependent oxidoreductase [Clostridiales bacterium]|nr:NAD(P)/FAD-dependent oxidoreductase [Clostridiales bacterium]